MVKSTQLISTIIAQTDEYVVLNKPAGLLVHSAPHMKIPHGPTLVDWLKKSFPQTSVVGDDPTYRPGIVHRLDKDTSGVMVVALSQESFDNLKQQFAQREMHKEYRAIVQGVPADKKGTITLPIGVKAGTTKRTTHGGKDVKDAVTHYEVLKTIKKEGEAFADLTVSPQTGRTHQIRVHLNAIHHPIVGDQLYGGKTNAQCASRLMLHAWRLTLRDQKDVLHIYQAPIPGEFIDFLSEP